VRERASDASVRAKRAQIEDAVHSRAAVALMLFPPPPPLPPLTPPSPHPPSLSSQLHGGLRGLQQGGHLPVRASEASAKKPEGTICGRSEFTWGAVGGRRPERLHARSVARPLGCTRARLHTGAPN
jgi:hypothetical protein